ncbi:DNA-binding response regulator, OmpR family, contains REC and winged-helix (wHTH) domain [Sporobacter termitidis DSM 10068]|uniref:Stage 0 sporulation protein A homolog n=1 Tax=Sporobacter termitidis DSM 10068 TaxID=1123282 RepID=A0A1M5YF03_9FIRM|nr:response regulator transcription factor [Sporobacter termitidis]SHI10556.1 DNA-binding response regulator, OmpR family, contains REC and winged-helix (wHTH) domain [Sporobacter termitidis DSM 10068]
MGARILLIEDEEKLARFVELELTYEGYAVTKALNGRAGSELAQSGRFDLILLDIMLPEMSGMEVLRRLRRTSSVPVIMLTARDGVTDKVAGLDLGADDYVTKPFAIEELLARIRAALRKNAPAAESEVLTAQNVTLDVKRHTVSVEGQDVDLTKREFDLLHYLLKNKGIVVTREALMENVWDFDFDGGTNTVDVYIRFLRGKLDEAFNIKLIHTVRGVGYVIKDE